MKQDGLSTPFGVGKEEARSFAKRANGFRAPKTRKLVIANP